MVRDARRHAHAVAATDQQVLAVEVGEHRVRAVPAGADQLEELLGLVVASVTVGVGDPPQAVAGSHAHHVERLEGHAHSQSVADVRRHLRDPGALLALPDLRGPHAVQTLFFLVGDEQRAVRARAHRRPGALRLAGHGVDQLNLEALGNANIVGGDGEDLGLGSRGRSRPQLLEPDVLHPDLHRLVTHMQLNRQHALARVRLVEAGDVDRHLAVHLVDHAVALGVNLDLVPRSGVGLRRPLGLADHRLLAVLGHLHLLAALGDDAQAGLLAVEHPVELGLGVDVALIARDVVLGGVVHLGAVLDARVPPGELHLELQDEVAHVSALPDQEGVALQLHLGRADDRPVLHGPQTLASVPAAQVLAVEKGFEALLRERGAGAVWIPPVIHPGLELGHPGRMLFG